MEKANIKNLELEDYKEYYCNVPINSRTTEFEGIACSNDSIAFPHCAEGVIGLMKLDTNKTNPKIYKLRGHKSLIQDIEYNPYKENIIASSGNDCCILIWDILNINEDNEYIYSLNKHIKRCSSIKWNPIVNNLLLSIGQDQKMIIWDIENCKDIYNLNLNNIPICTNWNIDGSLISYIDNDAILNIIDIRLNKIINYVKSYNESKKNKIIWIDGLCGSKYYIISTGTSCNHLREIKLWDIRNINKPINIIDFDSSPSALYPFYDEGLGIIVLLAKGETICRFVKFKSGNIKQLNGSRSSISQGAFGMLPKTKCIIKKCEIMKFLKVESRKVYTSSIIVPKKNKEIFCPDIYPDIICEANLSINEWINFENKPIVRTPFLTIYEKINNCKINKNCNDNKNDLNKIKKDKNVEDKINDHKKELFNNDKRRIIRSSSIKENERFNNIKNYLDKINKQNECEENLNHNLSKERSFTTGIQNNIFTNNINKNYKQSNVIDNYEKKEKIRYKSEISGLKKDKDDSIKLNSSNDLNLKFLKMEEENKKMKKAIIDLQKRVKTLETYKFNSITNTTDIDELKNNKITNNKMLWKSLSTNTSSYIDKI